MRREYTPAEFIDITAKINKRPEKVSRHGCVAVGYRADGISLTGQETEKISNIVTHLGLQQHLLGGAGFKVLLPY